MIKEGGASNTCSARTIWTVHSQYKGTVKSKYVDITISLAWPSLASKVIRVACKGLGWRGSPATLCIQVATVSEVLDQF